MCAAVIKQHNASLSVACGLARPDANAGTHWAQHEVDLVPFHQTLSGRRNDALFLSYCTLFSSFLLSQHSACSPFSSYSLFPASSSLLFYFSIFLLIYYFPYFILPFLILFPNFLFFSSFLPISAFPLFPLDSLSPLFPFTSCFSSLSTTISTLLLLSLCPLFSHIYSCLLFFLAPFPYYLLSFFLLI